MNRVSNISHANHIHNIINKIYEALQHEYKTEEIFVQVMWTFVTRQELVINSDNNVAIGFEALKNESDGSGSNVAIGSHTLSDPSYSGNRNIAIGTSSLQNATTGQSNVAIGNGGMFGQGIGQGTQTQYGFLSEPQTDFIFAATAEEFGLLGVTLLLSLFIILLYRMFKIGIKAQSNFPRLFVAGFATLFIAQFFVNVGMNLGLLPIIGLSLPLVSYGGSSLLAMYAGLGVLLSIKTH